MNLEELTRASCYEELELLLTLQGLQSQRAEVFNELANYRDNVAFCIPTKVGFVWYSKNSLKRVEAPQEVGGDFYCNNCASLTSLAGAPEKVSGFFWCSSCFSLTSLVGAPEKVGRGFDCSNCSSLTSLEGAPQEVSGNFYCHYCTSLTSLEVERLKKSRSYKIISSFNRF